MTRGKWKPMILWQLGKGSASLSQLEDAIEGITQKMLLEHLKDLMEFNVVDKTTYEGFPLKVEYHLTERGRKLLEAVVIMQEIGVQLM
ncbi:winged helix-turn-helix transcriptional regulator [Brevibacillus panacihumi]|uniref:winged helix-turn-helix transcriptional regulator n=1 Tax=Brevibacillus panacihumi TaxID=497735 RepID=UPI0006847076|nr:helix-turn-helix domain-containing protein [Brevibacillus panacihumi]